MGEVIVTSSYEAAYLTSRGHKCRLQVRPHLADCDFIFRDGKALKLSRQAYLDEVDLHEFITAHRSAKWQIREIIKKARNTASPEPSKAQGVADREQAVEQPR